jgi:Flp pilus assembly protein TadD
LYSPALKGGFIFDDLSLPLSVIPAATDFSWAIHTTRPLLTLSYLLNAWLLGNEPSGYHVVNLLIHAMNTGLVFLVLQRLLAMAGWIERRRIIAACAGTCIFLIHPLQTESVSYIAGRSESLASLFLLLAYTVFLYRREESISWRRAVAVLLLFGLAVKTKENAVSLAGVLVLTDLVWPQAFSLQGLRKNWRLYGLMVPGALLAAIQIFRMLSTAGTAGFAVDNFKWYEYGFTQARAIFAYLQLAILPLGQALDHDFPASHTITEHGALVYLTILACLIAAAIYGRRRYPLACFGFLMFLMWLAPTSSIVPVTDPLVERRMYLPLMGLILVGCDAVDRLNLSSHALWALMTVTVLTLGAFCYTRNQLWGNPELLIALAGQEARHNPRPMINLANMLTQHNRCDLAVPYLQRAERILPGNYFVNASWGRTLACLGRPEEGLRHLQLAAEIQPCSQIFVLIGLVYGQMGRSEDAGAALRKAVDLDSASGAAHGALALWYENTRDFAAAEREYSINVSLDPSDRTARRGLERVRRLLSSQIVPTPYPGF